MVPGMWVLGNILQDWEHIHLPQADIHNVTGIVSNSCVQGILPPNTTDRGQLLSSFCTGQLLLGTGPVWPSETPLGKVDFLLLVVLII